MARELETPSRPRPIDSERAERERSAHRRVGTMLRGKYRLDDVLGQGGMAIVYAATHRNNKRFAVKMLRPELSTNADVRSRFLREGFVANSVGHPGAVAMLDEDTDDDGNAFLVMELLEGVSVDELWEVFGGRLGLAPVMAIVDQLLDVLAAAHSKAIVHRDIKPANLFVTRAGAVKVLDFGIARLRDAGAFSTTPSMTTAGAIFGTPGFMAPEQAMARTNDVDEQTDVWAVGAVCFSLLSGKLVHEGDNSQQVIIHAATKPARSLAVVAPDVDARIVEVVDRALAFEKSRRWPSAVAMRDALRAACIQVLGREPSPSTLTPLLEDAVASSRRVLGGAATLAADESSGPTLVADEVTDAAPASTRAPVPQSVAVATRGTLAQRPSRTTLIAVLGAGVLVGVGAFALRAASDHPSVTAATSVARAPDTAHSEPSTAAPVTSVLVTPAPAIPPVATASENPAPRVAPVPRRIHSSTPATHSAGPVAVPAPSFDPASVR